MKMDGKNEENVCALLVFTSFNPCCLRFWHLVETSIEDSVLAPLSKDWISNMNTMVPSHLLKLKEAYKNFLQVRSFFHVSLCEYCNFWPWNGVIRALIIITRHKCIYNFILPLMSLLVHNGYYRFNNMGLHECSSSSTAAASRDTHFQAHVYVEAGVIPGSPFTIS